MDFAAYHLINNKNYQLPTRIPFGEYGGNQVEYHGYEMDVQTNNKGQRFTINRNFNPRLTIKRGNTYYFDQSLKTNAGFPLRFSTSKDGAHRGGEEYQAGVVIEGVPGKRGSYVRITLANNAPDQLHLYCSGQPGMAGNNILMIED